RRDQSGRSRWRRGRRERFHHRPRATARARRSRRADPVPLRHIDPARAPGLQRSHADDPPLRPPHPRVRHGPPHRRAGRSARTARPARRRYLNDARTHPPEPARTAGTAPPTRYPRVALATSNTSTSLKILVPGNHLMVGLLGQRDELLRLVEAAFPVQILVRGNEITITGDSADAERVGRLFEEMVVLLEQGHELDREGLGRSIAMLKADQRPSEVLTTEVVRGRKTVRPKTAGQKRYVDAVRDNTVTFAIGPAGTGKSYLAVALAVQALQAKEVNRIILTRPAVEAGERLGFLPGDMMAKVDPYLRPLYDALYDMLEPES